MRFYEEQGLPPTAERTPAGYRDYTPETADRIDFIHRGQAAGLTHAPIRQTRSSTSATTARPPASTCATSSTHVSKTSSSRSPT
ncbi:MerR family transcriptional regulator [Nocardioides hungaricus]